MKSNANDAELIAEAYATHRRESPEVIEEFLPAIAAVAGGAAKMAGRAAGGAAKIAGRAAGRAAGKVAGKVARTARDTAVNGLDFAANAADEALHKLASPSDEEHNCGYEQVLEPVVAQVSTVDESEMHVALADLHKASKYAAALTDLLGNVGSLEGWTAVKIAKAADYLGAVFDKLDYDLNGHSVHNTGYEDAPTEDNQ
jgi:hypothetical protein